jgi:hypothetical protein
LSAIFEDSDEEEKKEEGKVKEQVEELTAAMSKLSISEDKVGYNNV